MPSCWWWYISKGSPMVTIFFWVSLYSQAVSFYDMWIYLTVVLFNALIIFSSVRFCIFCSLNFHISSTLCSIQAVSSLSTMLQNRSSPRRLPRSNSKSFSLSIWSSAKMRSSLISRLRRWKLKSRTGILKQKILSDCEVLCITGCENTDWRVWDLRLLQYHA